MENKKYTKGTKVYIFKLGGSGRWTNYQRALTDDEQDLLVFAQIQGYVTRENDAKRGGKSGEHFFVKKYFTTNSMAKKRAELVKARNQALAQVLPCEKVDEFRTISDIGSIKIDGACYSNFWGDGDNIIEVCRCDESAFHTAKYLSRREIYNSKQPITINKFESPKTIVISNCDCDDSFGAVELENVLGFVIWERKAKIFVK